jgi:hypothetical protein
MKNEKPKFQEFKIPSEFLNQIYELTGNVDKNKGYLLCYIDENGYCQMKFKYDSQATEFAIMKFIDLFVNQYEQSQFIEPENPHSFGDEEE